MRPAEASLIAHDLRSRLHIVVHGFETSGSVRAQQSVTEANFVRLTIRLTGPSAVAEIASCRALRRELKELAEAAVFCAERQQSRWHQRLLDCPLLLWLDRPQDRGPLWSVTAVLADAGVLSPGRALVWEGQELSNGGPWVKGLRFEVRGEALNVFGRALDEALRIDEATCEARTG